MRRHAFIGASLVFLLDYFTKYLALRFLSREETIAVIPGVFHITLVSNTGAAFGILKGFSPVFISLAVFVIALIILLLSNRSAASVYSCVAMGLLLGGALGNLYDRVFYGHVIDFLDFRIWPVFNVADSGITVGAAMLALGALNRPRPKK